MKNLLAIQLQNQLVAGLLMICSSLASAQSDSFRISEMNLRDPHVFVDFLGCRDITDTPLVGFSRQQ